MADFFSESNEVPIVGEYDVIVVGGGVAGVSAALAARRWGCDVLIIEKSVMLGGLATLGLIAFYPPLCDGKGRKVVGGIAEELLHLSIKYGYNTLPKEWQPGYTGPKNGARYATSFSPAAFAVALDEIVTAEGIDVLFDTLFCRPVMEDGWCKGIIVENKSGRVGYRGRVIIDTTGDADVMAKAGAECVEGHNRLAYWAFFTDLDKMREAVESGDVRRGIALSPMGVPLSEPSYEVAYSGVDAEDITRFILDGRALLREELSRTRSEQRCYVTIPAMAQLRTTRRIRGYYELTEKDIGTHFDDSIGRVVDWRNADVICEIPYRALIARGIHNIITAGRTIAAAGDAWEITRVIPSASVTGQAAGIAAASAVEEGCSLSEIPIFALQWKVAMAMDGELKKGRRD